MTGQMREARGQPRERQIPLPGPGKERPGRRRIPAGRVGGVESRAGPAESSMLLAQFRKLAYSHGSLWEDCADFQDTAHCSH